MEPQASESADYDAAERCIRTTQERVLAMLSSDDYGDRVDTTWLDARIARPEVARQPPSDELVVAHGALVTAFKAARARRDQVRKREHTRAALHCPQPVFPLSDAGGAAVQFVQTLGKGRSPPESLLAVTHNVTLVYDNVRYELRIAQTGPTSFALACPHDAPSDVLGEVQPLSDGGFFVQLGGKSQVVYASDTASGLRLTVKGQTCLFSIEYDPTALRADVAGKLSKQLVPEGAHVNEGDAYAEIEVLKMFMTLQVGEGGAGRVRWKRAEGAALSPGDLIATIELDAPEAVTHAEVFSGVFLADVADALAKPAAHDEKPHVLMRSALTTLERVLAGYAVPRDSYRLAMDNLAIALADRMLPLYEFEEAVSALSGKLTQALYWGLQQMARDYRENFNEATCPEFAVHEVLPVLDRHGRSLEAAARPAFIALIAPLRNIAEQYSNGTAGRTIAVLLTLVRSYLQVERTFRNRSDSDAWTCLRRRYPHDLGRVFDACLSHSAVRQKNELVCALLRHVREATEDARNASRGGAPGRRPAAGISHVLGQLGGGAPIGAFIPVLTELAGLSDKASPVALEARKLLIDQSLPSREQRRLQIEHAIGHVASTEALERFVSRSSPMKDLLLSFLSQPVVAVRRMAMQMYVRKTYQTHEIQGFVMEQPAAETFTAVQWTFKTFPPEALPPGLAMAHSESSHDMAMLRGASSPGAGPSDSDSSHLSDDARFPNSSIPSHVVRHGVFAFFLSLAEVEASLPAVLAKYPPAVKVVPKPHGGPVHVLHVAVLRSDTNSDTLTDAITQMLRRHLGALTTASVRRVTFLVGHGADGASKLPGIYTFRTQGEFAEDVLSRHIEPPHAFHLDLMRLTNFAIRLAGLRESSISGNVHIYEALPKRGAAVEAGLRGRPLKRFFLRVVSITSGYLPSETERLFVESLNALELRVGAEQQANPAFRASSNHVFLNIVSTDIVVEPAFVEEVIRTMLNRYWDKAVRLGVAHFEVKMICRFSPDSAPVPLRLLASNPSGYVLKIETYVEVKEGNRIVFRYIGQKHGLWDGIDVTTPYPIVRPFERERSIAFAHSETLYCHDFLELFEHAVELRWEAFRAARPASHARATRPAKTMRAVELVVQWRDGGTHPWTFADASRLHLVQVSRPAGKNDVGMVAWLLTLRTPEAPEGRQLVLIANDITVMSGSFGTREDVVFDLASKYARERGLPRLYLAANSGARIGLSATVRERYRVAWVNATDPTQGFEYLYLTPADYAELAAKTAVNAERVVVDGEERFRITDVIGDEADLGVENLCGSGTIAGETARAYTDIFTLTLVVGRAVGIGAYLVRLGHRTIQCASNAPIILTGHQALNKLLGRAIYTSNEQLGGANIMIPNGVSHIL